MTSLKVVRTIVVNAPRQKIWRAITEPADLIEWYAPGCRWEISQLRPGSTVRFFNTDTDIQEATIETVEPQKLLSLRWRPDNNHPFATLLNTYQLDEAGESTHVTITQSGYETAPDGAGEQWYQQDEQAFTAIAAALKDHAERK